MWDRVPSVFRSEKMRRWRCSVRNVCCLVYRKQEKKASWATVLETSDSKWFITFQAFTAQMPSKLTDKKKMDPCCTPPFLSFLPNSIPQCTCLVRERERGERESHLTLTGMLMWAAMQLQQSIPLHSSTGAQAAWQPQLACRSRLLITAVEMTWSLHKLSATDSAAHSSDRIR